MHFTHFSFTVQLPVWCFPTVVVWVVGTKHLALEILSFYTTNIMHGRAQRLFSLSLSLCRLHRIISWHSWLFCSNGQPVQMPLWTQLWALSSTFDDSIKSLTFMPCLCVCVCVYLVGGFFFLKHMVSIWQQQPWMLSVTDAILHLPRLY